jgi:peroxiredoxin
MKIPSRLALLSVLLFTSLLFAEPQTPWEQDELTGFPAPDLALPDMKGKMISLSDFKGKVVLLNFWTTWCPPCREEIPFLNTLSEKYKGKDFVLIGISTDISDKMLEDFLKKNPVRFLVLHDAESKIARKYKAYSLPTSYLIDRNGKIIERFLGSYDWSEKGLMEKINRLL